MVIDKLCVCVYQGLRKPRGQGALLIATMVLRKHWLWFLDNCHLRVTMQMMIYSSRRELTENSYRRKSPISASAPT